MRPLWRQGDAVGAVESAARSVVDAVRLCGLVREYATPYAHQRRLLMRKAPYNEGDKVRPTE